MAIPKLQLGINEPKLYAHCGSATDRPMQTLSFPVVECDGVKYVLFEDHSEAAHLLEEWYGIAPTEAYDSPDGNNMVELAYLMACNTIAQNPEHSIGFSEWMAAFEPIDRLNGAEGDFLHQLSGPDFDVVKQAFDADPLTVWTALNDVNGNFSYGAGFHRVNRDGYVITKHPHGRIEPHVFDDDVDDDEYLDE